MRLEIKYCKIKAYILRNGCVYLGERNLSGKLIKAVIFDQDGLMFDSERLVAEGWAEIGARHGYTIDEDFLKTVRGRSTAEIKVAFQAKFGNDVPFDEMNMQKRTRTYDYIKAHGIPVKPGLKELLAYLYARNIPAAVATSSSREWTEGNLHSTGIAKYFKLSVYGEMVSRGKPAPDIFLLAAEKLGEFPAHCLVLEDSLQGNEAAINGGFVGIMVPDLTPPTPYLQQNLFAVCPSLLDVITLFEEGKLITEQPK